MKDNKTRMIELLMTVATIGFLAASAIGTVSHFVRSGEKEPDLAVAAVSDTADEQAGETPAGDEKPTQDSTPPVAENNTPKAEEASPSEVTESASEPADGSTSEPAPELETGETEPSPAESYMPASVEPYDFAWFDLDGFPYEGTPLTGSRDRGGHWKCKLVATTPVNGTSISRMVLSDAELLYEEGQQVTVLMHTKGRYEFPAEDPESLQRLDDDEQVTMTFRGECEEETGYISAVSVNSSLTIKLYDFAEANGNQYAAGTVYNGDTAIGYLVMVRNLNE